MINDLVGLKKKLDTIKTQRQKDAKDLSLMRHLKDKAVQVCGCVCVTVWVCECVCDSVGEIELVCENLQF